MKKILFCALFVCALPMTSAWGQNRATVDDMTQRIERLEREIDDLRAIAYGADGMSGRETSGPQQTVGDPSLSRVLVRLDQLEAEIRTLTGLVEELNFKVQQSASELQSLSQDTDYRLQALEGGNPASMGQRSPSVMNQVESNVVDVPDYSVQPQGIGATSGDFKEQYDSALTHLKKGEHDQAEASLKQFIADHGDTELASNAQYWLGESYYVREMYRDAAASFLEGVRKFPDGKKAPDSMLKLGMSLAALGQVKEACTTFTEIPRRYPSASQTIIQRSRNERAKAGCS